jgi:hypothetical protein
MNATWIRIGSVIAFPNGWQRPAKTEEWVYESLLKNEVYSPFVEFICFPWATLIDLIDRKKFDAAKVYIDALKKLPPKKTLIRATACQHLKPHLIEEWLKNIKVTDLYWSHKSNKASEFFEMRIHPLALYPVSFFDAHPKEIKPLEDRKHLYSFVGAYDETGYISDIRKKIFSLTKSEGSFILRREQWHFEREVYGEQIAGNGLSVNERQLLQKNMTEYAEILGDSIYSLCPSGAGVNSIRLWESILFGAIPIVFSDQFYWPEILDKFHIVKARESNFELNIKSLSRPTTVIEQLHVEPDVFIKNVTSDLFNNNFVNQVIYGRC